MTQPSRPFRILVVGDMHGHWGAADSGFIENGDHDLVVFVGDLGDEDVDMVEQVTNVELDKAVILGNHDAWRSFSNKLETTNLRRSLDVLGSDHLAYALRELKPAGLSLVGARPFSWGGEDLRSPELYGALYDVRTLEESARRIAEIAAQAEHEDIVILAHNGPHGLGRLPSAIYGKDFGRSPGGDWGDQDLEMAIEMIEAAGRRVRAVIAGHMHDKLLTSKTERRTRFVQRNETSFLNPAVVPRVRKSGSRRLRHFLRTDWSEGRLGACEEVWIDGEGVIQQVDPVEFVQMPS